MRTWIPVLAIVFVIGSILLTMSLTGPSPPNHDSIKAGMTQEDIERILPKQDHTDEPDYSYDGLYAMADAARSSIPQRSIARYHESGVIVRYADNVAEVVYYREPKPRSYLRRLIDSIF